MARFLFGLLGLLMLAAIVYKLAPYLVAAAAVWLCLKVFRRVRDEAARRDAARAAAQAALVARCDQQHAWVLAGDDRGVYGDLTPP